MKIKTATLTGLALDYAVGLCEGFTPGTYMREMSLKKDVLGRISYIEAPVGRTYVQWAPTKLKQGDDIIDREEICTGPSAVPEEGWAATFGSARLTPAGVRSYCGQTGITRREAAMRCYVASKLGDEVDVPPGLLEQP